MLTRFTRIGRRCCRYERSCEPSTCRYDHPARCCGSDKYEWPGWIVDGYVMRNVGSMKVVFVSRFIFVCCQYHTLSIPVSNLSLNPLPHDSGTRLERGSGLVAKTKTETKNAQYLEPSSFARLKASLSQAISSAGSPLLIPGASSPPLGPLNPFDRIRASLTSLRGVDTIVTLCFRSVFCMSLSLSTVKVQSMPPHVLGSCFRSEISSPWILSRFDAHPALLSPPLCGPTIKSCFESSLSTRPV